MNNVIVLCVGLMGAANPAHKTAENPQPVQVAFAGCNLASGGHYQPSAYRSPVAQRGQFSYSTASCNCPPGACAHGQCLASCSNGQCSPLSYSAGTSANCANGQCSPNGGKDYGPNYTQQNRGSYYPSTATRYNPYPATRYPVGSSTQLRRNTYSTGRTHNGNWTNTYRPVQPSSYYTPSTYNSNSYYNSNTTSPFFN